MAQDVTAKRQAIEVGVMNQVSIIIDAVNTLNNLQSQRAQLGANPMIDADFTPNLGLAHITAAIMGTFLDFCLPTINTNIADAGNSGRNTQIMLQIYAASSNPLFNRR